MKYPSRAIGAWLVLAGLCLPAAGLRAAEAVATSQPDVKHLEDVAQQRFTKAQFEQLTTKMIEVADLLEKAEPQTAKVLREAVAQAQRAFIAEDMEKVAQYLTKGLASAAASTQGQVIEDLKKVLQTLRHGILDLDERLERIKKWQEFLGKIEKILDKQRPLERQSNVTDKAAELAKQADALSKELADIVAEQKKLKTDTGELAPADPAMKKLLGLREDARKIIEKQTTLRGATQTAPIDKLPVSGQIQKHLAAETDKLAEGIAALAKDPKLAESLAAAGAAASKPAAGAEAAKPGTGSLPSAADSAKQASGQMKQAADALGKSDAPKASTPQDQALSELKKVEKALEDVLAKKATKDAADDLAKKQESLSGKTSQLSKSVESLAKEAGQKPSSGSSGSPSSVGEKPESGNIDKAAEHMKDAAKDLKSKDRDEAVKSQQKALEQLETNKYKIAELKRLMAEQAKTPMQKQAQDQNELADQGEKLDKQMGDKQDTPGQKSMSAASKSMSGASKSLSKSQAGQANSEQKKAIDEMEKAREELADAIKDEQDLAQAEQLAKIDQLLQKALDQQVAISSQTAGTHGKRAAKDPFFERPEQIKLREMSDGEGKLAEELDKVRAMLDKEGNSVVFPEVLKEIAGDMRDVQKLLDARDAGPFTQGVQKEIERGLQEMIDSIRKELAERRKKDGAGGGGGGGGGGGKQPLVPPIAELKMIRTMQIGINRRTAALSEQAADKKLPADQVSTEHKKLGQRQETVLDMTKKLKDKISRGQAAAPGPKGF